MKEKSTFKSVVMVISIIVMMFSAFYLYSYFKWKNDLNTNVKSDYHLNNNTKNNNSNDNKIDDDKPEEDNKLDINSDLIKGMYDEINSSNFQLYGGNDFIGVYYEDNPKRFTENDNGFIIYRGIIKSIKNELVIDCSKLYSIDGNTVKSNIISLFGSSIKYTNESYVSKDKTMSFTYDKKKDSYTFQLKKCGALPFGSNILTTKIIDAEQVNDRILIYEKVAYLSYTFNDKGGYLLHYHNGYNINSPIVGDSNSVDMNSEKINTYIYELRQENNYYLYGIYKK